MPSSNEKTRKAASTTYATNLLRSAILNDNSGGGSDVCVVGAGGSQGDWFLLIFLGEDAAAQAPRRCRNRSHRGAL